MARRVEIDATQALARLDAIRQRLESIKTTIEATEASSDEMRKSFASGGRVLTSSLDSVDAKVQETNTSIKSLANLTGQVTKTFNALGLSVPRDLERINAAAINVGRSPLLSQNLFNIKPSIAEAKEEAKGLIDSLADLNRLGGQILNESVTNKVRVFSQAMQGAMRNLSELAQTRGSLVELAAGIESISGATTKFFQTGKGIASDPTVAALRGGAARGAQAESPELAASVKQLDAIGAKMGIVAGRSEQIEMQLSNLFDQELINKILAFGNTVDAISFARLANQISLVISQARELEGARGIIANIFEGPERFDPTQLFGDPDKLNFAAQVEQLKRLIDAQNEVTRSEEASIVQQQRAVELAKERVNIQRLLKSTSDSVFNDQLDRVLDNFQKKILADPMAETGGYADALGAVLRGEENITAEQAKRLGLSKELLAIVRQKNIAVQLGLARESEASEQLLRDTKRQEAVKKKELETNRAILQLAERVTANKNLDINRQLELQEALSRVRLAMKDTGAKGADLIRIYDQLTNKTLRLTAENAKLVRPIMEVQRAALGASSQVKKMAIDLGTIIRFNEFRALSLAFYTLSGSIRQAYDRAIEFGTAIGEIQTISREIPLSFDAWARGLSNISTKFNLDLVDTATAAYQALSNQIAEGPAVLNFMSTAAEFSKATVSSLANSVDSLTGIINAYGLSAGSAQRISDELFNTIDLGRITADQLGGSIGRVAVAASQLGLSTAEMNAALSTITRMGFTTPEALTRLSNLMQKLVDPSEKLAELYRSWGVPNGPAAIASFGFTGVLDRLAVEGEKGVEVLEELFQRIRAFQPALILTTAKDQFVSDFTAISQSIGDTAKAAETVQDTYAQIVDKQVNKFKNLMTENVGGFIELAGFHIKKLEEVEKKTGEVATLFGAIPISAPFIAEMVTMGAVFGGLTIGAQRFGAAVIEMFGAFKGSKRYVPTILSDIGAIIDRTKQDMGSASKETIQFVQGINGLETVTLKTTKSVGGLSKAVIFLRGTMSAFLRLLGPLTFAASIITGIWLAVSSFANSLHQANREALAFKLDTEGQEAYKLAVEQTNAALRQQIEANRAVSRGVMLVLTGATADLLKEVDSIQEIWNHVSNAVKKGLDTAINEMNAGIEKQKDTAKGAIGRYYDFLEKQFDRDVAAGRVRGKRRQASAIQDMAKIYMSEAEKALAEGNYQQALEMYARAEKAYDKAQSLNRRLDFSREQQYIYEQTEAILNNTVQYEEAKLKAILGQNFALKDQGVMLNGVNVSTLAAANQLKDMLDQPFKIFEAGGDPEEVSAAIDAIRNWAKTAGIDSGIIPIIEDGSEERNVAFLELLEEMKDKILEVMNLNKQLDAQQALRKQEELMLERRASTKNELAGFGEAQASALYNTLTADRIGRFTLSNIKNIAAQGQDTYKSELLKQMNLSADNFVAFSQLDAKTLEGMLPADKVRAAQLATQQPKLSDEKQAEIRAARAALNLTDEDKIVQDRVAIQKAFTDPTAESLAQAKNIIDQRKKDLWSLRGISSDGQTFGAKLFGEAQFAKRENELTDFLTNFDKGMEGIGEKLEQYGKDAYDLERIEKSRAAMSPEQRTALEDIALLGLATSGQGTDSVGNLINAANPPADQYVKQFAEQAFPGAIDFMRYITTNQMFDKNPTTNTIIGSGITPEEEAIRRDANDLFAKQLAIGEAKTEGEKVILADQMLRGALRLGENLLNIERAFETRGLGPDALNEFNSKVMPALGNLLSSAIGTAVQNTNNVEIIVNPPAGTSERNIARHVYEQIQTTNQGGQAIGLGEY